MSFFIGGSLNGTKVDSSHTLNNENRIEKILKVKLGSPSEKEYYAKVKVTTQMPKMYRRFDFFFIAILKKLQCPKL